MKKAPVIRFHTNEGVNPLLRRRRELKQFLINMFKREAKQLHRLTYIFCSDEQLLEINMEFLQHDTLTDIITFDLSDQQNGLVGEIYISVDRVLENAVSHRVSEENELHRVVFHGALHLIGYDDKTDGLKQTMRKKEDEYLHLYFNVPRGT